MICNPYAKESIIRCLSVVTVPCSVLETFLTLISLLYTITTQCNIHVPRLIKSRNGQDHLQILGQSSTYLAGGDLMLYVLVVLSIDT